MSFQQALSGLSAASKNLDVISNNVANATTSGFKQAYAVFSDMTAAASMGSTGTQIGIGTQVTGVNQEFSQGAITVTNNPLDVAISGQGFMRMSDNGAISYTRNGGFSLDKNGFIVGPGGQNLTGYGAVNGAIVPNVLVNLQLSTADLAPRATSTTNVGANLAASESKLPAAGLDVTKPTTYNFSTSSTAYDSLGVAHTMTFYFNKEDPAAIPNTWTSSVYVDGNPVLAADGGVTTLTFDSAGAYVPPTTPAGPLKVLGSALSSTPGSTSGTGGAADLSVTLDYSTMTQFSSAFSVNSLSQNGSASGTLSSYSIDPQGIIYGKYTNGQNLTLGQIPLSNFTNTQGLLVSGNGMWLETALSGPPLTGVPGTASLGVLQASATEDSNVDLTAELVNMITAQRVYQANAQSIKTQDQLMQTITSLR